MKFGKIRIEDGNLLFIKHMMINNLPCRDIIWAYVQREEAKKSDTRIASHAVVIITRRRKKYQFDMTEREALGCIRLLKALNPDLVSGFPKGGRIPLQGLQNTRDLGGLEALDHRHVIPHRLLRSGDLYHLSLEDQRILQEEYKLKKVIDLRTASEREHRPDTILAGVEYYHIPLIDEEMADNLSLNVLGFPEYQPTGEEGVRSEALYESIVRDDYGTEQLARVMDVLRKDCHGAVLWHGGAGKDRTGIVTALLLCILRIPRKVIREDFIRSNGFLEEDYRYLQRYQTACPDRLSLLSDTLSESFFVQERWLSRLFRTIDEDYGSMARFMERRLLLGKKEMEDFRGRYLL